MSTPEGLCDVHPVLQKKERIPTRVFVNAHQANRWVAQQIADTIRNATKKPVVLGLATGSTPVGVYKELIRMHKEEGLSFKDVVTFNLDEYYPMRHSSLQSYHTYMKVNLFDHIDIDPKNCHIPSGEVPRDEVEKYCEEYEQEIMKHGGIDLQILGIGRTGHIGFNEPGSSPKSTTRLLYLDKKTRLDAAADFFSLDAVPQMAITMGIGTILSARRIILLAYSESKASIIQRAVEGPVDEEVAASYLQTHPNATVIVDMPAAVQLARYKAPWTLVAHSTEVKLTWDERSIKKAVIWLALQKKKPILKLTADDYIDGHLQHLLNEHGPAHKLNVRVFSALKSTITGWPGGKPQPTSRPASPIAHNPVSISTRRPADYLSDTYSHINPDVNPNIDNTIFPKRVLIFSPHPDDDVISMGGTLIRLVEQGHEVHVAYQTSGNIAVWDDDALRFANFVAEFARVFNLDSQVQEKLASIERDVEKELSTKKLGQVDSESVLRIKALIRATEARAAARYCGVLKENIHFLDLPFYESGTVKKKPLGKEDIEIVARLLNKVKPHQVFAAGDLSDPHGTHRVCLQAVLEALRSVRNEEWFSQCQLWLYRGAWQEWDPEDIQMAIPMSPQELRQKRYAIFKHQSQKDVPPFPGSDPREFWQRAEDRNRATAALFDRLGLPEYEAMEAFVKFDVTKDNPIPL